MGKICYILLFFCGLYSCKKTSAIEPTLNWTSYNASTLIFLVPGNDVDPSASKEKLAVYFSAYQNQMNAGALYVSAVAGVQNQGNAAKVAQQTRTAKGALDKVKVLKDPPLVQNDALQAQTVGDATLDPAPSSTTQHHVLAVPYTPALTTRKSIQLAKGEEIFAISAAECEKLGIALQIPGQSVPMSIAALLRLPTEAVEKISQQGLWLLRVDRNMPSVQYPLIRVEARGGTTIVQ